MPGGPAAPRSAAVRFGVVMVETADQAAEAAELEALGFDCIASGEHLSFNGPVPNAFISLSLAAGATSRIRLISAVTLTPLYPPALLAKLGAALDVASNGRFELGVGVGGESPREFEAVGVPRAERGARTTEALDVITRLWTEETVSYEGRFTTFRGVGIDPRPQQRPHPPIWVSGRSDAALRRAARFGTGWLPYLCSPQRLATSYVALDEMAGRPLDRALLVWASVDADRARARTRLTESLVRSYGQGSGARAERYGLCGTPDEVAAQLRGYLDAGVGTVLFVVAGAGAPRRRGARLLAEQVLPLLRTRPGGPAGASGSRAPASSAVVSEVPGRRRP